MSHLINPPSRIFKKNGQSAIEFIFIIPFLMTFILVVVEFSLLFVQTQRVSALSREAVNTSFRDCSALPTAQLNNCINTRAQAIGNGAGNILFGFNDPANGRGRIIISVYSWDESNGGATLSSQVESGGASGFTSHFSVATINPAILRAQGTITIGEVFYQYKPMTIVGLLLGILMPESLYEVTAC